MKKRRNQTLLVSALPILLVFALYMKNLYLFGNFGSSSRLGMSISKLTTMQLSVQKRIELIQSGKLTELALMPPFKALWFYGRFGDVPKFKPTGVPVLDLEFYEGMGNNGNNAAYLPLSRQYLNDALTMLRIHPTAYLSGAGEAFRLFFFPATDWLHMYPSIDTIGKVAPMERLNNMAFGGNFRDNMPPRLVREVPPNHFRSSAHMGFFILFAYIVSLGYAFHQMYREFRTGTFDFPRAMAIFFMVFTIVYVTLAGNFIETGENFRFRFTEDPLILILLGMFVQSFFDRFKVHKGAE